MKGKILTGVCFLVASQIGLASEAKTKMESKIGGVLRVGTGTSGIGGDQVCFNNPGSLGNEFRLGNECGAYGDIEATVVHFNEGQRYFLSKYRVDFFPAGHTAYDNPPTPGSTVGAFNLTELFVEAGGYFDQSEAAVWIGKRFMRDGDVHMNDFFHYGAINGNGAGVKDLSFGSFKVDFSQFLEVAESGLYDDEGNLTTVSDAANTDKGSNTLTFWDLRIKDIMISNSQTLKFWLGFGSTSGGSSATNEFESLSGSVVGTSYKFASDFFSHELALMQGTGVMESLDLSQSVLGAVKDDNTIQDSKRLRLVNSSTFKVSDSFEGMFALIYEDRDSGAETDSKTQWTSIGVRPTYFFSDHYSTALELGNSVVDVEGEDEKRTLTRSTLAFQMHPNMGQWTRPVLRAFVTNSSWNEGNKVGSAAYADKTSETSTGFQAELWF